MNNQENFILNLETHIPEHIKAKDIRLRWIQWILI